VVQFRVDDRAALKAAIQQWFEPEHGLIDVWAFDTTTEDWQKLLDFVSRKFQGLQYVVDSEPQELPSGVDEILSLRPERSTSLQIKIDGIALNSYFFCREEIDFDFNPREVRQALALQHVLEFLRRLADLLNKEVVVTPEGAREFVIFRVRPGSDVLDYRQTAEAT
jgi:hypothetical protein